MLVSSVQAVVACYVTALRVCTLVLFIVHVLVCTCRYVVPYCICACTFGYFSASFHWTEGSGLEEPWPTIVGPKILARLSLGILLASEKEATLERCE